MTTPPSDGQPGDLPFLPPAAPTPPPPPPPPPSLPPDVPPAAPTDVPVLPSARPPEPAPAPAASTFDAKAMVESQKHYNPNPAYGAMPAGTDESRAAARKLREQANRKRRRNRVLVRVFGVVVLAGLAVGGFFAYQAIQDDPPPLDTDGDTDTETGSGAGGDGGALTPLGEQEQVIEVLDDLNSGARPSAGGLLDAVDDAREVVGQADPSPDASPGTILLVADVFTPAVVDHADELEPAGEYERFVVRGAELLAADPNAHAALVDRLLALPQVADDDPRLAAVPVVLPGDIGIAIQRDVDRIERIVAVAADPAIRAAGP